MATPGTTSPRREARIRWMGLAVGAFLTAGCGFCLHFFTWGNAVVRLSYDLLTVASPHEPVDEVLMVYLDEESHRILDQPYTAIWDRAIHAFLIRRLSQAGARAIVLDIVMNSPNPLDPEGDQILRDAIAESGRVVLAADHVRINETDSRLDMPFDAIRAAAAAVGSAEVIPGPDMILRQHTPPLNMAGFLMPSLSYAAAQVTGATSIVQDATSLPQRWLHYYGPADWLPSIPYHEAIDPERVPDDVFRDKVVFVGARLMTQFTGQRADEYPTPYTVFSSREGSSLFVAGVEMQATAFVNLWRGDWLTRGSVGGERVGLLLLGLLLGAGLVRCRPFPAVGLACLAVVASALASYALFQTWLLWIPWVVVVVMAGVAAAWSVLFNTVQLYVQKRLIEQTLAIYLPPKLVKKFSRDPKLLQPGATKANLTILFTDIAGFTSISEGMDSDELADMMNQYFEGAVSGCIHASDGTVGKYIGDAILAFWNAPDAQTDHAWRACQAALLFRVQEASTPTYHGRRLHTRIGIHTGVANVGNFGSTQRVDYTVLGENVNLASRLEGLNKYLGTLTVISGETRAEVGDKIVTRRLGRFRLKGFQKPVEVHELIGEPAIAQDTQDGREAFAAAMDALLRQDWDAAEKGFEHMLKLKPDDGPTKFYLAQLPKLRTSTLPSDWLGDIDIDEK